mmetsp:Transcript_78741/g.231019  ORF Transcript_78741/g.231019 Transcript_78741/m.231019 type:complete len:223 (-) Transcript_78741:915-1583(-)
MRALTRPFQSYHMCLSPAPSPMYPRGMNARRPKFSTRTSSVPGPSGITLTAKSRTCHGQQVCSMFKYGFSTSASPCHTVTRSLASKTRGASSGLDHRSCTLKATATKMAAHTEQHRQQRRCRHMKVVPAAAAKTATAMRGHKRGARPEPSECHRATARLSASGSAGRCLYSATPPCWPCSSIASGSPPSAHASPWRSASSAAGSLSGALRRSGTSPLGPCPE